MIELDHKLVSSAIIETLERSGALQFDELFGKVVRLHSELSEANFQDFIMELEIKGLIRVYDMARGIRRIEKA
jgi:hypothetical protein